MGKIPENVIEEIRSRADIVEVIREVVPLKKAGRLWRGRCPFHDEKDPSFTVYQDTQIFKCFGCQKGGNVFGFIMEYNSWPFPDAVKYLGERLGIEVPETGGVPGQSGIRERMFEINEIACAFFKQQLKSATNSKDILNYLYQKRKLTDEWIDLFELGYALNGWDGLLKTLQRKNADLKIAAELGLIVEKGRGQYYDRFRNSVMFTFRTPAGKIIGFSGRCLDDSGPKYMNSPESVVFKKGSNFFGLNLASREISKKGRVIVSEGNFDLVMLHKHGFPESLAVLGSGFTEKHASMLSRFSDNVYLLFDGDDGGRKITWRALELFLPSKVHPKVAILPEGEDPDSFLETNGGEALQRILDDAPLAMDYALDSLTGKYGTDVEGKTRIINELMALIEKISEPVRQDHYIAKVAQMLGVNESAVRKKLSIGKKKGFVRNIPKAGTSKKADQLPDVIVMLMTLCIVRPALAKRAQVDDISEFMIDQEKAENAVRVIESCAKEDGSEKYAPGKFLSLIENPELLNQITSLILEFEEKTDVEADNIYEDLIKQLKIGSIDRALAELTVRMAKAKKENNIKAFAEIVKKMQGLIRLKEDVSGDFFLSN